MKREDLRKNIIPTKLENSGVGNGKEFNTTDFIYLDSYDEQYGDNQKKVTRLISPTYYAQLNKAYKFDEYKTPKGIGSTLVLLRSTSHKNNVDYISANGECYSNYTSSKNYRNMSIITL